MNEQGTKQGRWQLPTALAVATAVIVFDQASKAAAGSIGCGPVVCSAANEQLMLGIGGEPSAPVVVAGVLGLIGFGFWARTLGRAVPLSPWGVGLVLGGALGNLIDRIAFASVRDFLVTPFGVLVNLADLAIVIGLGLCLGGVRTLRPTILRKEVNGS